MVDSGQFPNGNRGGENSDFQIIWMRYRWVIIGVFVLVIAAVAVNEFLRHSASNAAQARFEAIENNAFDSVDIDASPLAQLAYAEALIAEGNVDAARETLAALSGDKGLNLLLKQRADLMLASLDDGKIPKGETSYDTVAQWLEIDALLGAGDDDAARERLQAMIAENESTRTNWAETLLLGLGGKIPETDLDGSLDGQDDPQDNADN